MSIERETLESDNAAPESPPRTAPEQEPGDRVTALVLRRGAERPVAKSSSGTKIFGLNVGFDPRIIIGLLIVMAGVVYWFNSRTDDSRSPSVSGVNPNPGAGLPISNLAASPSLAARSAALRRGNGSRETDRGSGVLKVVSVDGSHGDRDPTLRLGLLDRVRTVPEAGGLRNIFEGGNGQLAANLPPVPLNAPRLHPTPLPTQQIAETPPGSPPTPPINIPLKYYGFAKPLERALDGNRGLFMDGDNVLAGAEGDVLEKRYLIVTLNANAARLEDIQLKQGQDLPITPEAAIGQAQ